MVHLSPHPSRAAIAGHPIHPALVPIPIGLLTASLASDLAYVATGDRFWARASKWLTGAGLASAAVAAPFGSIDFWSIPRARRGVAGWIHLGGNVTVLGLAAASLALRVRSEERAVMPAGLALSATIAGLLAVTGWMGGELIIRKGVAVVGEPASVEQVDVHRSVVGG